MRNVLLLTSLLGVFGVISQTQAAMFSQCSAVNLASGCNILITVNADSTVTVTQDASQGPYDGSDDQLIGIQNNLLSGNILSISLTGPGIFGFDGDGLCTFGLNSPSACPFQTTTNSGADGADYAGPQNTFVVTDGNTGSVNFLRGGIAPAGSTYFSLEAPPSAAGFTTTGVQTGPSTPEPASVLTRGGGLCSLAFLLRKRGAHGRG